MQKHCNGNEVSMVIEATYPFGLLPAYIWVQTPKVASSSGLEAAKYSGKKRKWPEIIKGGNKNGQSN